MFSRLASLFRRRLEFSPKRLEADRALYITAGLLLLFGLIMLASASSIVAYNTYSDTYYFFKRQFVSIILGVICFWIFSKIDYRFWRKLALPAFIASVILLLLVFIPGLGREINSSQSWIYIFGFSVQPSSLVKLTFIIYLAALFEKSDKTPRRFYSFLIPYGIITILMLLQPDLGTLLIITAVALAVYFVGGGKFKHIFLFLVAGVIALILFVNLPGQEYKLARFRCFLDAQRDTRDTCYQVNQSLIAIGSGGIFGRGLGESRQKFLYLPEVQNDFIFSIVAEETGLVGGVAVVILFAILTQCGWRIVRRTQEGFGQNLVVGIIVWISGQAILNIGGITNFLPMTGVPLPLISYGGTSIVAILAGLGIVASVSRHSS